MNTSYTLRPATESDLVAINDIYNHYVQHSTCTYQEEPEPLEGRRQWFNHHGDKHPVIVAVAVDSQVVGWGALSAFHERSAYQHTVENSIYVHHQYHRRGIGSLLLQELIVRARNLGHRVIIAGIDGEQTASVALHTKFHFEKVGHLKRVGFKFGRSLDVIYLELQLDAPGHALSGDMATMQPTLTISPDDPVGETARKLIHDLCAEVGARYGRPPSPFSLSEAAIERTIFLIARLDKEPVGCGAVRRIDEDTAEVKRMYVAVAARRRGVAKRILAELERSAIDFGYRAIRLETGILQPEAQRLYESCDYKRIAAFGHYVGNPTSVCYEKML